jgi:oligopeptide/dipeptide ABC transporter ATP-binding protein
MGHCPMNAPPLLSVEDLVKYFPTGPRRLFRGSQQRVHAVDGVSFTLNRGETLGLVGESGCGKSTVARLIVRLLDPTAGRIVFDGADVADARGGTLRRLRRKFQIVFQDPYSSLNGRFSARDLIAEPLAINGMRRAEREARAARLIDEVGLSPAHLDRYPHEFSGGQRQRLGIARALALNPSLLVLDEPVSALDVSVQAQIINLLMDLQKEHSLSFVFVSHDLSVVRHIADRVAVMYLGRILEIAEKRAIFENPRHPYTQALISAVPRPRPGGGGKRIVLRGDVPSPIDPPAGCRFHTRCPNATELCRSTEPAMERSGKGSFACHHPVGSVV